MHNQYTSGEYLEKNPTWSAEDSPWKAQQIIRMLRQHDLEPKSICEVGCGAGAILDELHQQLSPDVSFVGYDISPQAYALAREKAKERLTFHLADLVEETVTPFDLLIIMDVIEHVEDYFSFLKGIRPKATHKVFHIPLDMSVLKVLRGIPMRRRRQFGHIHYFMKETALASLEDAGYEIVDYFFTSMDLDMPSGTFRHLLGKTTIRLAKLLNAEMAIRVLGGHSLLVLAK